ncbi:MAG: peptidylprolyl isomerase [Planctomycetales bacterium]
MRDFWLRLAALGGLLLGGPGCDSFRKVKSVSPVMPAPPPRIFSAADDRVERADRATAAAATATAGSARGNNEPGEIVQVSAASETGRLEWNDVVATVNGEAIFASDILRRYSTHLDEARRRTPPVEFDVMQRNLVRRDLSDQIERTLLLQSLNRTVPEAQLANLKKHLDKLFEEEVDKLKKELTADSTVELEAALAKRGTSLAEMRAEFDKQRMAMEYLGAEAFKEVKFGRQELLDYYERHSADYDVVGRARWQQIVLSFRRFGTKADARGQMERIVAEIDSGTSFDDAARRYSDDPNAKRGGHWDWTRQGSLADREVDLWLFAGRIGEVSPIIESKDAFKLVRVVEREPAGRVPFEKVQGDIKEALTRQVRQGAARELLDRLRREATIVTMFDADRGG